MVQAFIFKLTLFQFFKIGIRANSKIRRLGDGK